MSDFTKGQWISRSEGIGVVDDSDTQTYGMLRFVARVDEYDFESQSKANANLIAAAPDMYDVIESIINTWDGPLYRHEMAPNIDKARKALAKARGEK